MILPRGARVRRRVRAAPLPRGAGVYTYARLGHGTRRLELQPGGQIGEGAAGLERWWRLEATAAGPTLVIGGTRPTTTLSLGADGTWRGRWLHHEGMYVELRPVADPAAVGPRVREAVARALVAAERPRWSAERGIVVCAGGSRLLTCAWVLVTRLRELGCALPIELWHLGEVEAGPGIRERFRALGVDPVDARQDPAGARLPSWSTWELKPVAMSGTRFREALLLDADNVPLRDPGYLFDHPAFRQDGALFWPDFGQFGTGHPAWTLLGLPPAGEVEQESGQLLLDRGRVGRGLAATVALNRLGRVVYAYVHGDKDTWWLGFRMAGLPYRKVGHPVRELPGVMLQHDPDGRPLFQHRNLRKWQLRGPNPSVPGFQDEPACRRALAGLAAEWDGVPVGLAEAPEALGRELRAAAGGRARLTFVGFETLSLRLGADHTVTEGRGPLAARWWAGRDGEGWALIIEGDRGPTARLRWTGPGRWEGAWPGYPGVEARLESEPAIATRLESGPRVRVEAAWGWERATGPAHPGGVAARRHLRPRGDRPGFEPVDPGPLSPPDQPAGGLVLADRVDGARRVWWRGPLWDGRPVERLVVNLGGGLGDVVRWLPLLAAIRRSGRVGEVRARVLRDPGWFQDRLPGIRVVSPDRGVDADAGLPSLHELPRHRWGSWPRASLVALGARAVGLPVPELVGPCLEWADVAGPVVERLEAAGWRGEPLVAVQGDPAEPLERWRGTYEFRRAKFVPELPLVVDALRARGAFVVWIGTRGGAPARPADLDLRGEPLGTLVGAVGAVDLLLGVDSGPAHVAGILGTPALALFGPSDPLVHVCAAGTLALVPPSPACPHLPCGLGSLVGQPQSERGWLRPIRCPEAGPCLHRLDVDPVAELAWDVLRAVSGG